MNQPTKILLSLFAAAAAMLPLQAMAEELATGMENVSEEISLVEDAGEDLFSASAISDSELSTYRGTALPSIVTMNTNMVAVLEGNSVDGGNTGTNSISDSAFNNVSGLTSVIQNSGNNVIIMSSFQVNVNME